MIIATSGHIDHGKTKLVKALTGIDTDRLPEEKSRGISIDLGYAYHELDHDKILGFVDVPGHEKFVRNMLAGVTGIDYALLVIAADDGPMPQTEEHLAILDLLGVSGGAVAITKIDRVEASRLEEVITLTEILLDDTSLSGAPIFPVSGITGVGVTELWSHLKTLAANFTSSRRGGNFRLAIDRCFTVPGAGLVVTGSVFSGEVKIGERLTLSPAGIQVRVRGIHAQNRNAESGEVGQRCAINITGPDIQKGQIHRGDWLLDEAVHAPTRRFDARIQLLKSEARPLKHWSPVHLHTGTADISARVALLDGKSIPPGDTGRVQLVLDESIGVLHGDRLILRDQSARRTIAGGDVIDPFAPSRGRSRPQRLAAVSAMEIKEPQTALTSLIQAEPNGINLSNFSISRNLTPDSAAALWSNTNIVISHQDKQKLGFSENRWDVLCKSILMGLEQWHREKPDQLGLAANNLRLSLNPRPPLPFYNAAIGYLATSGKILLANRQLRLPGHQTSISAQDKKLWAEIRQTMENAGLRPLSLNEVADEMDIKANILIAFMRRAATSGFVTQISKNRFLLPEAINELAEIAEILGKDGKITAGEFRDRSVIGRNMAIEVLEFFDKAGLTKRTGNSREIVKPAIEVFGR